MHRLYRPIIPCLLHQEPPQQPGSSWLRHQLSDLRTHRHVIDLSELLRAYPPSTINHHQAGCAAHGMARHRQWRRVILSLPTPGRPTSSQGCGPQGDASISLFSCEISIGRNLPTNAIQT